MYGNCLRMHINIKTSHIMLVRMMNVQLVLYVLTNDVYRSFGISNSYDSFKADIYT